MRDMWILWFGWLAMTMPMWLATTRHDCGRWRCRRSGAIADRDY